MKNLLTVAAALCVGLAAAASHNSAQADTLIGFEDLGLGPESYYNGSDGAGGFTSGGAFFNNDYSFTFDAWQGWAASTTTDTTTNDYTNQYSALPGTGGSAAYGVAFSFFPNDAYINLPTNTVTTSIEVTNTTYTALTIRDGDPFGFSSPFGGASGNDPDFFLLTITGYSGLGATGAAVGSVDFYLADYRFDDPSLDYIVSTWQSIDLASLAGAVSLGFSFTADRRHTDDLLGLTVPTYVAVDNLRVRPSATVVPEPSSIGLALVGTLGFAAITRRRLAQRL